MHLHTCIISKVIYDQCRKHKQQNNPKKTKATGCCWSTISCVFFQSFFKLLFYSTWYYEHFHIWANITQRQTWHFIWHVISRIFIIALISYSCTFRLVFPCQESKLFFLTWNRIPIIIIIIIKIICGHLTEHWIRCVIFVFCLIKIN